MKVILSILLAAVCAELRAKITVYSALGSRHLNGIQMISGISVDLISTMILLFSRKKHNNFYLTVFSSMRGFNIFTDIFHLISILAKSAYTLVCCIFNDKIEISFPWWCVYTVYMHTTLLLQQTGLNLIVGLNWCNSCF